MDVLNLSAQLTLDTSQYTDALHQAEDALNAFGQQVQRMVDVSQAALSSLTRGLQGVTQALQAADRAAHTLQNTMRGLQSSLPGRISL